MKKSNAKEVSISPATAGEIIQKAITANLAFKKDRGVKDYALAKEYGISRHTVREALRDLRVEGLVHSQRGRGTFVAAPDPHPDEVGVVIDADVSRRLGLPADAPLSLVERVRRRPGHAPSLERTWTPAPDLGT